VKIDRALIAFWLAAAVAGLLLYGPYHLDELGQIVAFSLFKLGIQPAADLPWEYAARMRPWLQPAVYAGLMRPVLATVGYHYPTLERLLVLAQLPLVTAAMVMLARMARAPSAPLHPELWRLGRWTLLAWFWLPSMLMRHSAEAWSTCLLVIALSLWYRGAAARHASMIIAGAVAGLAFWLRFQLGLFLAPFWLMLLVDAARARQDRELRRLAFFALGVLFAVAINLVIDAWGYGAFVMTPVRYVLENIFAGRAAQYGRQPFWFFVPVVMLRSLNPLVWGWLILAMWLGRRDPFRRALSLGVVVFVLVHSAIAHKEERFLIPMAGPAALLLLAMFAELASRAPSRLEQWLVHVRVLGVVAVAGVIATLGYSAIGLVKDRYRVERSLWNLPAGSHVLADTDLFGRFDAVFAGVAGPDDDFVRLFLRPPGVRYERVRPGERNAACAAYPNALVLLTTADLPRDMPNPVDLPMPAVAAFPAPIVGEVFGGMSWYRRIWRFRLVRCADFAAAGRAFRS
jgi:hypothetical protein